MQKKVDFTFYFFLSVCIFEAGYITQISKFSPAYFGWGAALALLPLIFLYKRIFINSNCLALIDFCFLYLCYLILDSIVLNDIDSLSKYVSSFLFNHGIFIMTIFGMRFCSKREILKVLKIFLIVSGIFLFCDFVYRVFHSTNEFAGIYFFYNFKMNALMFTDSNWTGFIGMTIFSFLIYLREEKIYKNKNVLSLFFVLVCLSFSRAAIISCIALEFFIWIQKRIPFNKNVIIILCIFLAIVGGIVFVQKAKDDDSFGTKLALLKGLSFYVSHFPEKLLLGNGMGSGSSETAIELLGNVGYAGHLYVILKVLDIGVIGFVLELYFFFLCCKKTQSKYFYMLFPFLLCGLSMCPSNLSFFYMQTAILVGLENENYRK